MGSPSPVVVRPLGRKGKLIERTNPPPGLRATFAATKGVLIKELRRGASPRRIKKVEKNFVVTENIKTGHLSRIRRDNLSRYVVVQEKKD